MEATALGVLILVLVLFAWLAPVWIITERTGRNPAWSLLTLGLPLFVLLYLWWLAYAKWPRA
jgi:hypothetical protein